jgi:hypothetical protein
VFTLPACFAWLALAMVERGVEGGVCERGEGLGDLGVLDVVVVDVEA